MEYPTAKQVKHKLITAIIPRIISIGSALLTLISAQRRIMLNGGSQSLRRGLPSTIFREQAPIGDTHRKILTRTQDKVKKK